MTLRKQDATWTEAKKQLGDPNFLMQLVQYDKEQLTDSVLNKVNKYTREKSFDPEVVGSVSKVPTLTLTLTLTLILMPQCMPQCLIAPMHQCANVPMSPMPQCSNAPMPQCPNAPMRRSEAFP